MKYTGIIRVVLLGVIAHGWVQAQTIEEIVRYSSEQLNGSARYQAMGGAFGALGGDLSSITNNPAGSSVFSYNEAGISMSVTSNIVDANYLNGFNSTETSSFDINHLGLVLVFSNPSSKWDKISFGFNTQNQNNFNKNIYARGTNYTDGLEDYFFQNASEIPISTFDFNNNSDDEYAYLGANEGFAAQQAYLGLYTGAIGHDDTAGAYFADGNRSGGINQIHERNSKGGQQVYTMNISGRYMEKLSIGFNINIYSIDYTEYKATSDLYEDANSPLQEVNFAQDLNTFGTGVSFQFGALLKASEVLRLGLSVTSPTYYELEDEYTESLEAYYIEENEVKRGFISPNVINVVGPYKVKTPAKAQASVAFVFGKSGLLSLDYGIKDYASATVDLGDGFDSATLSNLIDDSLTSATYFRLGGESRLGDISIRGGYWMEESPYQNNALLDELRGFSFGLGLRFGPGSVDLAYTKTNQNYRNQLYYTGLTDSASVNQKSGLFSLSYNIRF
jgi:hypothetical protein